MSGHSKWDTIKHKKAINDAKKGKVFSKLSVMITHASRQGGGDPVMNPNLRLYIDKAKEAGFSQVLWLDAIENRCIEEVGTMNIMFVIDGTIVTPPLEGSILPGVTRNSVISLAKHWGIPVEERKITIDEVFGRNSKYWP